MKKTWIRVEVVFTRDIQDYYRENGCMDSFDDDLNKIVGKNIGNMSWDYSSGGSAVGDFCDDSYKKLKKSQKVGPYKIHKVIINGS